VVIEFSDVWDFLAGFVREGVVNDDDTVTAPLCVVCLLEKRETFSVELVFVSVVFGEELVQGTFAFGRKNEVRDVLNGLGVVFLPRRETLQLVDWFST